MEVVIQSHRGRLFGEATAVDFVDGLSFGLIEHQGCAAQTFGVIKEEDFEHHLPCRGGRDAYYHYGLCRTMCYRSEVPG